METERVVLREWRESDAEALFKYASDPEVGPRAGWPPHKSVDESREIIRTIFSGEGMWAVELKETGEPIGCAGYLPASASNLKIEADQAEVGYWIGRPYWGKGICTEALHAVIDYCFHEKGFSALWGDFFPDNPASGKVMAKCGFKDTGKEVLCPNLEVGADRPVKVMKLENRNKLYMAILSRRDESQVEGLMRFFKTGPGQYGEGDKFLGIKVPVTREVVKACWQETGFQELEECIGSKYHEVRLAALLALVEIFSHARKDKELQQQCIGFYLSHTQYINNWDLVDLSCYQLVGTWLLDKDRKLLYDLASNGKNIWEQRIGMVSTMQFIRHGQLDDTFAIADILLHHKHDLIQKAVGWLLREAGKRDVNALKAYLEPRFKEMPRTMLRYAIEKLPESERKIILKS